MLPLIGGCDSISGDFAKPNHDLISDIRGSNINFSKHIPIGKIKTSRRILAAKGIKAIEEKRLKDASLAFNQALSLEITNSYLQFLNAYTYHLMANRGDASKFSLAAEGYKLSINFDPTNWVAHYQYGLLFLDQRKYPEAQRKFADAVFYKDDDPDLFYHLAYASYYARDPITAAGALNRLEKLKKNDVRGLRASAFVMAALGQQEESRRYLKLYASLTANKTQIPYLSRRLEDWQRFYKRYGNVQLAQAEPPAPDAAPTEPVESAPPGDPGADPGAAGDPGAGAAPGAAAADQTKAKKADLANKMVIVDVVIIRTEETITSSRGFNLLSGLELQFGGTTLDGNAFTFSDVNSKLNVTSGNKTTAISRIFGIPSVTYYLNIMNAATSRN